MTACKCRRCGKLYEPYAGAKVSDSIMESNGVMFINNSISGVQTRTTVMDLCPECMAGMAAWWNKSENQKEVNYEQIGKKVNS